MFAKTGTHWILAVVNTLAMGTLAMGRAEAVHVWEKTEIVLEAQNQYGQPYVEVEVWVELEGPTFKKRCYGFWDGGRTFRVRVLATAPGEWTWRSGSNQQDAGLNGKTGSFTAIAWTEAEKKENHLRRGMIRNTANGHAFEFPDGEPFFLLGDTWWAVPTFRYPWREDDKQRPLGKDSSFQDFVRHRRAQGFNCLAMIAAHPCWANDGRPARINMQDGTVIRAAWKQLGTNSAKDMHDEAGNRAFHFPGKVPGFEKVVPDLERINPAYFQSMDRKIDFLNAQGIAPFIEVARRDIGQVWKKFYPWPDSYTRYIQYVYARYQANICLLSPIHFDTPGASIPAADWNRAAHLVLEKYGPPPFGGPRGTNSAPSSLRNWGHTDQAKWLTFHQIGNNPRTHDGFKHLTEIFNAQPPVPGINGEPYYDGMDGAESGSEQAALYARCAMYGSFLSGGLGGHIYGAGGWDGGMWGGNVEDAAENHIWDALKWPSGDDLRHLRTFALSAGKRYQELVPQRELLTPNATGKEKGYTGWAYCARTPDKSLFLLYFEKDCPRATLTGLKPGATYDALWFDSREGKWLSSSIMAIADDKGQAKLPGFPLSGEKADKDWGLKLVEKE